MQRIWTEGGKVTRWKDPGSSSDCLEWAPHHTWPALNCDRSEKSPVWQVLTFEGHLLVLFTLTRPVSVLSPRSDRLEWGRYWEAAEGLGSWSQKPGRTAWGLSTWLLLCSRGDLAPATSSQWACFLIGQMRMRIPTLYGYEECHKLHT